MNILIVDDSVSVRLHIVDICNSHGYDTIEANNGVEALEILRQQPIDLLLTDINMPEMNGIELLEAMKEEGITTTSIAITTNVSPKTMEQAKQLGMKGWMIKPLNEAVFISLLEKIDKKTTP